MKQFVLTEEQYKKAVEEGVLPQNSATKKTVINGDDPSKAGREVTDTLSKPSGQDTPIEVTTSKTQQSSSSYNPLAEGRLISKKELKEERLKKLRENSEIVSVKEIFGI